MEQDFVEWQHPAVRQRGESSCEIAAEIWRRRRICTVEPLPKNPVLDHPVIIVVGALDGGDDDAAVVAKVEGLGC